MTYPTDAIGIAEAAATLAVSIKTIRRWIKAGRLPAWRLPGAMERGRLAVSRADVLSLAEPVYRPRAAPPARLAQKRETQELMAKWGIG